MCLNRKKNMPTFRGMSKMVKKTINLIYPIWYMVLLLTSEGLHLGPAYMISHTMSRTMLATTKARVSRMYVRSKKFIK